MNEAKKIEWILRVAIAGEFIGHGVFAIQGKKDWIGWVQQFGQNFGVGDLGLAGQLLFLIGLIDVIVALAILFRPCQWLLLGAAIWGFWTALVRPLVGLPVWDFIERWANWGAPLALFYLRGGLPKNWREWWR